MLSDPTLRWVVTALFGAGIAAYAYVLVVQRNRSASPLGHVLHLTMAAAMILMAWRIGMELSAVVPMIFFGVAGVGFVWAASRASTTTGERLINSYYAAMTAAMVWMYAVMSDLLPRGGGHAAPDSMAMEMPGMRMPGHEMGHATAGIGWIAMVNWTATLGFAVVALYWSCRWVARRQYARVEPLYQACTAAGTATMFFALL
ncbi:DUF5134 domain-containing protein [Mycobacterium rhizamassiliense]|uniref:DUF5134 domain-containing protein n=1 Tax=Mycobacterium rhizamassiliense TaxID=1841860 RepID=A0A2U3NM17_9MYCO|nr:DUF5134 domain-containing protein [Mycobacterium rhizamassiliense]SPM32540.1 DUF5134 domain-containing protein [Mycobacterium rhizamassiliense]